MPASIAGVSAQIRTGHLQTKPDTLPLGGHSEAPIGQYSCKYGACLRHIMLRFIPFTPRGGRYSAVGPATRYGLDGPGIESRWGRDFPLPYRTTLGPIQHPVQ